MTDRTDAEVIQAAESEAGAFAEPYRRHASPVYGWFRRRLEWAASDVTAETFAQAWLSRRSFRDEADGSAFPWLLGIARNVARESARRNEVETRARRRLGLPTDLASDDGYAAVDARLSPRVALTEALETLPLPGRGDYWLDGAWSRDDSRLAYVTDESIVILQEDRVLRRVPLGRYDSASGGLAWSPDGQRLVYGEGGLDASSLWLVRVEDGSRSLLVGGEDNNVYPVWSPSGRIYYEHGSFDDSDGLRTIAPDGTGDTKITDDDWGDFLSGGKNDRWLDQARVSPDGTKIAYMLGERGAWTNWSLLGVMNADGSGKTPLPGSL